GDLFTASRTSRSQPFESLTPLASLNSPGTDACLVLTADRLTAYFESDRSANVYGLWTSTRASTADSFPQPTFIDALNNYGEGGAYLTAGDRVLYFHSWRGALPRIPRLYRVERLAGGGFGPLTNVSADTGSDELSPVVTPDELTIYFARYGSSANPDTL